MNTEQIFIGVDPGKSGSIGFIQGDDCWSFKLDGTYKDIADAMEDALAGCSGTPVAMLEKVHSMPGQGVKSTFNFGQSFGMLQMLLTCHDVKWDFVTPAKWQKAMGCLTKGDKNVSKAAAQRLFPSMKIIHANADAMLLAEYARRTYNQIQGV